MSSRFSHHSKDRLKSAGKVAREEMQLRSPKAMIVILGIVCPQKIGMERDNGHGK
jgi:hypothetical protein